jgi:hypothetical protein
VNKEEIHGKNLRLSQSFACLALLGAPYSTFEKFVCAFDACTKDQPLVKLTLQAGIH